MTDINTKKDFDDDILTEAKQLTHRIAVVNPWRALALNVDWRIKFKIQISGNHESTLPSIAMDYNTYNERTFLIHEWKHYILINTLARILLRKGTENITSKDLFVTESLCERITNDAYMMILDMHQKWVDKEDLSLFVPSNLYPWKMQIIEEHLRAIHSLNLEDEAEGTLAYLLHDYCKTMLIYECIFQIANGIDLKFDKHVNADYAAKAYILYNAMINKLGVIQPKYSELI